MSKVNADTSSIGQSVTECKEDIRSILYRLKAIYDPCDLHTARAFSENLLQSIFNVFDDFIADIEQDNCSNQRTADGAVKNEEQFNSIDFLDSLDEPEMLIKSECAGYTEAQCETTSRAVIDDVPIEASSIGAAVMNGSSMFDVADIEQDNSSNGIITNYAVKNEEDVHSNVFQSISNFEDEPEMEMKFDCTDTPAYTPAQYETTSPTVTDSVKIEAPGNSADSMDISLKNEMFNTSNSNNCFNHCEKSAHKSCADARWTNEFKKNKAVGADSYIRTPQRLSGNIKCEVCQKMFKGFNNLIFHKRIHLDEFPFHCRVCLHTFSEEKQRSIHENNCDRVRYECYVCKSTLMDKGAAERHMRVHSGIKPFKCPDCDKTFSLKGLMKQHIVSIHDLNRSFSCELCPMQLNQERNLHRHKLRKHGIKKHEKSQLNVVTPKRMKILIKDFWN